MKYDFKNIDITFNDKKYGYYEYQNFAAKYLSNLKEGDRLAIHLEYTPYLIFVICWCLEKKITYIPIDIKMPFQRQKIILEDCKPDYIISSDRTEFVLEKTQYIGKKTYDSAYIIYSSGTTGSPKAIEITPENLSNFIYGISKSINFNGSSKIACITSPSFDIFFLESVFPIIKGISVLMIDFGDNPRKLTKIIKKEKVDVLQITPGRLKMIESIDDTLSSMSSLKILLVGGEKFPKFLLSKLDFLEKTKVYNLYGPTEATIWTSIERVRKEVEVSIGKPIANTEVYLLNSDMMLVDEGEIGEIYIGGEGVARGYYNNNRLTKENFKFLPNSNARVFKTGDLGKKLSNGKIKCLGREDLQIKIRGMRVELEEIEELIEELAPVEKAVVQSYSNKNYRDCFLKVAYKSEVIIDEEYTKKELLKFLPSYMIPVKFIKLDQIPYLVNGKIDRSILKNLLNDNHITYSNEIVENKLEREILQTIKENIDEQFWEKLKMAEPLVNLGIDSISFIIIIVTLEKKYEISFDDEKLLFSYFPTIKSIVDYVIGEIDNK